MANDLIGFGNDITKVRAQILENLEVIYSPVFQKELTERLSTMLSDAEITPEGFSNMAPVFQQLGIPLSLSNMVNILMAGFVIGLRHIIENPFKINRFLVWMMEFVYAIENPQASREHLHILFQLVNRRHQLSSVNMPNGEAIKKGEVIDYLKIFREEKTMPIILPTPSGRRAPRRLAFFWKRKYKALMETSLTFWKSY